MAIRNLSDKRINTRSPYYIDSREAPTPVEIDDPIEENTPPTVEITVSKENPCLTETVTLTAVATDSDGTIVGYEWTDGSTETTLDVTSDTAQSITYGVTVTDDDGDTAVATIVVHWQECVEDIVETFDVECGDIVYEGIFANKRIYNLQVGDKVGDVEIEFLTEPNAVSDVPVKFTLAHDATTVESGYLGVSWYDYQLTGDGLASQIATGDPTTKAAGTTLTINKATAEPGVVTLTAETYIPNDTFSFKLNCPNVRIPSTKYYTLEGTCETGDTTFTYVNSDGDTITVTLSLGETLLISALVDTPIVTSECPGDITEGGDSFDDGDPEQEYDSLTELTIVFDNSGSMNETLLPLTQMSKGNLKETLLKYYNNDEVEYNKRVRLITSADLALEIDPSLSSNFGLYNKTKERFLFLAQAGFRNPDSTKSAYLFFTDEVWGVYQGSQAERSDYSISTELYYRVDLASYRTYLDGISTYGEHFMRVFNVNCDQAPTLNPFIENIFTGAEGFTGAKGLSDRSECSVVSNIVDGLPYSSNPTYYYDLVIQALIDFGYKI
jgi:hypothetical protein